MACVRSSHLLLLSYVHSTCKGEPTCESRLRASSAAVVAPSNVRSSRSAQYTHSVTTALRVFGSEGQQSRVEQRARCAARKSNRSCSVRQLQLCLRHFKDSLPVCWCHGRPRQRVDLCCCMGFRKAPQAGSDAVEAQLLEVHAAGPQGGHQQLVQVLRVCWGGEEGQQGLEAGSLA